MNGGPRGSTDLAVGLRRMFSGKSRTAPPCCYFLTFSRLYDVYLIVEMDYELQAEGYLNVGHYF